MNYKFPKSEKLRLKKDIEKIFAEGLSDFKYPLVLKHISFEGEGTNLCAVSVPKKRFKKAVDRNKLKRQIREAYRLNKHCIQSKHQYFHLMFVYSNNEKLEYKIIENAMQKLLNNIMK